MSLVFKEGSRLRRVVGVVLGEAAGDVGWREAATDVATEGDRERNGSGGRLVRSLERSLVRSSGGMFAGPGQLVMRYGLCVKYGQPIERRDM